jgi:uncharacterized membrane protein
MSFEELFADVARVIEGVGVVIMTAGLAIVLLRFAYSVAAPGTRSGSYERLRVSMGRVILLGLEILIVGDIVRTIIVEASVQSVLVLGLIVVIRTVLSFALEVEISGRWPWQQSPHTNPSPAVQSPETLEEK